MKHLLLEVTSAPVAVGAGALDSPLTLGSAYSLLCGEKRCKNDTQSFLLSFQIRTALPPAKVVRVGDRHLQNKNAPDWVFLR